MKKDTIAKNNIGIVLIVFGCIILNSCGPKTIDEDIIGEWKSKKHKITVRIKDDRKKFKFSSDSTYTTLIINEDKTVSGNIGSAEIENGRITPNWLLPSEMTLNAYTIKCNLIGKIFENDPLETKDVQFWIGPKFHETNWELRYSANGAQFPMAFIFFDKQDAQ
jgi:hypothetical protein